MNTKWSNAALAWVTRILSVLFVALNAWGWWDESLARQEPMNSGEMNGDALWQWAVVTHLLPLLVILAATIAGWTRPMYGVIGFALFTVAQIASIDGEWLFLIPVTAVPVGLTALYLVGWILARRRARS